MGDRRVVGSVEVPGGDRDEMKATATQMFRGLMGARGLAGCKIYIGPCRLEGDIWKGTATLIADRDLDEEEDDPQPLLISRSPTFSPFMNLEGDTLRVGEVVYIRLIDHTATSVRFFVDEVLYSTESAPPWDFNGGTEATPSPYVVALTPGQHTIRTRVNTSGGVVGNYSATFTVQ